MAPRPWILACALILATSCGGSPGDAVGAEGTLTYATADGTLSLTYLNPPWTVQVQTPVMLELIIPAEVFGVALEGSPPTHGLRAGRVDETPGVGDLTETKTQDDPVDIPGAFDLGAGPGGDGSGSDGSGSSGGVTPPDLPPVVDPNGDIPDYLLDVDLENPRDVAFADLNYLIDYEDADLDSELTEFLTLSGQQGVVFQVVKEPGVFIRSFYFSSSAAAVRVVFVSLFDLETRDVDLMAETITTDVSPLGAGL